MSEPTITLTLRELDALLAAARRERPVNDVAPPTASVPPPVTPLPVTPLPKYLTTKEAAALLGMSPKGLEAMRARGEGPAHIRIGRAVRYLASELGRRNAG
jgi:hypothetical protein